MNYAQIRELDVANGVGIRVSIFFSGCTHHCPECFNQEYWDFNYGEPYTKQTQEYLLDRVKFEMISGLSLLGGEPFDQDLRKIYDLVHAVKEETGKSIWVWSGCTFEELLERNNENVRKILENIDVLVDGEFKIEERDLKLKFRGSRNQRILNIPKSLKQDKPVLLEGYID